MPFFVPVYLWRLGLGLDGLCLLLGISGLAFSAALGPWQRLAGGIPFRRLVGVTFGLEVALVAAVAAAGAILGEPGSAQGSVVEGSAGVAVRSGVATAGAATLFMAGLVGALNGVYNAFFWTTQRTLFATAGDEHDSGRRYGNLQIVVAVFLKVGILVGGVLVDADELVWALAGSAVIAWVSTRWLSRDAGDEPLRRGPHTSWRQSLAFRDDARSAGVFAVDGPFLYLESHFWTLSLFLLVREDSTRLGVVVVVLAVLFALLFLLVKNRIDRTAVDLVYRTSVLLYVGSWLLRAVVGVDQLPVVSLALLVAITFCSSLFRLAFNKRFFDLASRDDAVRYLVMKSHVSQLSIAVVFLPLAVLLHGSVLVDASTVLDRVYLAAAVAALVYLRYRRPRGDAA